MEGTIAWEETMAKAIERAGAENKAVLVFFHNPA